MLKIVLKDAHNVENWHLNEVKRIVTTAKGTNGNAIFQYFLNNLAYYVLAPAEKHRDILAQFLWQYRNHSQLDDFKVLINKAYKRYSDDCGYELVEKIGISTCPHCNRSYIFSAYKSNGNKGIRPELDHFYPKSKYPILGLNLYNLIPSCQSCNGLKSDDRVDIHPYIAEGTNQITFSVDPLTAEVRLSPFKCWSNKTLLLDKQYNYHKDYVQEILDKAVAYNNSAYEGLLADFQAMAKTPAELDRLVWGAYLEESDYHKRPLSKLTADILKQLDLL